MFHRAICYAVDFPDRYEWVNISCETKTGLGILFGDVVTRKQQRRLLIGSSSSCTTI